MVSTWEMSKNGRNGLEAPCVGNVKIGINPEHKIKIKRYFKLNLLWGCSIIMTIKISQIKL
jgi:hypothetical protein